MVDEHAPINGDEDSPDALSEAQWDLTVPFPSLESNAYRLAINDLERAITSLSQIVDGAQSESPNPSSFNNLLSQLDAALTHMTLIETYASCHVFIDETNTPSYDEMLQLRSRLLELTTRAIQMIGTLDIQALLGQSTLAVHHEPLLWYFQQRSQHLSSPGDELSPLDLNNSRSEDWIQTYRKLAAQTTMTLNLDSSVQRVPVSTSQGFAAHPDRDIRRHVLLAEVSAWESNATSFAAALNGIKGEVGVISRQRGWQSPLEQSIFENRIDRQTLDAMWDAVRASFPDFHRYLQAKAKILQVERLAWYDLNAPVGYEPAEWTFDSARDFIIEHFTIYSVQLGQVARRAFDEGWIDAEPRPGKPGYGLTMPLQSGVSRIMVNFTPSWFGVRQLAHELGHAYHIWIMAHANRTMLQQYWTPWTLAETASIFSETIIRDAARKQAHSNQRLIMLDTSLQQVRRILDHYAAFRFEQQVFEQRRERELDAADFNRLMLASQQEAYADALDPHTLNPYMWAALPHFYNAENSFNNYPYTFGLLFSLGLYAVYVQDPSWFKPAFDEMLSLTGMLPAHQLAARFGKDISSPGFWHASIETIRLDIDEFEHLATHRMYSRRRPTNEHPLP